MSNERELESAVKMYVDSLDFDALKTAIYRETLQFYSEEADDDTLARFLADYSETSAAPEPAASYA